MFTLTSAYANEEENKYELLETLLYVLMNNSGAEVSA